MAYVHKVSHIHIHGQSIQFNIRNETAVNTTQLCIGSRSFALWLCCAAMAARWFAELTLFCTCEIFSHSLLGEGRRDGLTYTQLSIQ
eukprot:6184776-Pleurochrysis_carterae.AAC.1